MSAESRTAEENAILADTRHGALACTGDHAGGKCSRWINAMPPMGEQERTLHDFIRQAEQLARDIQITSGSRLSLTVIRTTGKVLGWHSAHEAAVRIYRGGET